VSKIRVAGRTPARRERGETRLRAVVAADLRQSEGAGNAHIDCIDGARRPAAAGRICPRPLRIASAVTQARSRRESPQRRAASDWA